MCKLYVFSIFYLFHFLNATAQEDPDIDPGAQTQTFAVEDPFYPITTIETTAFDEASYRDDKMDINTVTEEDLRTLPGITNFQVAVFMEHRKRFGHFIHICELQTLEHWNIHFIQSIINLLQCKPPQENILSALQSTANNRHLFFWRLGASLQKPEAYKLPDSSGLAYQGGLAKHLVRWRYQKNKFLKAGVTLEKDAGERFVFSRKTPLLFDYYSWYVQIQPARHIIRNLIVGDFSVHLGQGLIRSNAFGVMASTQSLSLIREGPILKPYTSTQESNALRGLGLVISGGKHTEITLFTSLKKVDARTSVSDDSTQINIHSVLYDGYHRTLNEWEHLKQVERMDLGFSFKTRIQRFSISWQTMGTKLSGMLVPSENLHHKFSPRGNIFLNTSVDYSWYFRNSIFFGETAVSANGGIAFLHGCIVSPDKKTEIAVAWRHYDERYQALEAQAFGGSQRANNENGLFTSMNLKPKRNWSIGLFCDLYMRPWAVFGHSQTSFGGASKVHIGYTKRKKYDAYLQYQHRWMAMNQESDPGDESVKIASHRFRAHINISIAGDWELRSRIEANTDSISHIPAGFAMFQDIIYRPEGKPFSATARYAIFEATEFSNRIYAYENNLLYAASTTFYYGKGSRFYINFRWKINKLFTIELRYASTWQSGVQAIGEGPEKIMGNQKSELNGQLRLAL